MYQILWIFYSCFPHPWGCSWLTALVELIWWEEPKMDIRVFLSPSTRGTREKGWQLAAFWRVCTPSFEEITYELKKTHHQNISVLDFVLVS